MNIAGRVVCDGCDADLGNGNVYDCLVVSDVVDHMVESLHFCRDRYADDGETPVEGCARKVKHPAALQAYLARNPVRSGWPSPGQDAPDIPYPDDEPAGAAAAIPDLPTWPT